MTRPRYNDTKKKETLNPTAVGQKFKLIVKGIHFCVDARMHLYVKRY